MPKRNTKTTHPEKSIPLDERSIQQLADDLRSNLLAATILADTLISKGCHVYISAQKFNETSGKEPIKVLIKHTREY